MTNSKFQIKTQAGQSLFEVVFAIGMSALIITAVVILGANAVANSTFSKNKALAGRFTQETVEWLRSQRDADWEAFAGYTGIQKRCLPELDWDSAIPNGCGESDIIVTNANFKRELTLTQIDSANIQVKVRVYWTDGRGIHENSTVTNFTDWRRQ